MYSNADCCLKVKGCDNRDFYAGKCSALDDIFNIIKKFKDDFKIEKGKLNALDN